MIELSTLQGYGKDRKIALEDGNLRWWVVQFCNQPASSGIYSGKGVCLKHGGNTEFINNYAELKDKLITDDHPIMKWFTFTL